VGLYELLSARSDNGYYCSWIIEVYDNKFIYEDYDEYKFFRQSYTRDGDNVALDGEPVEVFNEWLSQDEKDALDALKSSYAELKAFKDNYDAAQLKAEKTAILASEEYAEIEEIQDLESEIDNYSVEELRVQADLLYAASMKKKFAVMPEKSEKRKSVSFNYQAKPNKKKQAYAGLFNKD
jgi:hypothetical protein